jgi:amino acid adenylation domain-containing protein
MPTEFLSPQRAALLERLRQQRGLGGGTARITARPDATAPAELSHGQRRLWFFDQLQPGNPTYNIGCGVWLHGPFDQGALETALSDVIHRHHILRTVFHTDDQGGVRQTVRPAAPFPVPLLDLGPAADEDTALERAEAVAAEPFDLTAGPLLRARLLGTGTGAHLLVLAMHHVVSDGWSLQVLIQELVELYRAHTENRTPVLPELPVQYADYAHWQTGWLDSPAARTQLGHWRERLAGATLLDLTVDRPRHAQPTFAGGLAPFTIAPAAGGRIARIAETHGTTPFVVGMAAFAAVLARFSGQSDVVIGTPVAGRGRAEVASLIGFFVNTLPVRIDVSDDPSLRDLVQRLHSEVLDARGNADIPFDHLVEELRPPRDAGGRPPLVRHLFQSDETALEPIVAGDLVMHPVRLRTGTAKFDLAVDLTPRTDGGYDGRIEYSSELFDRATADRIATALRLVLEAEDPDTSLSALPILTDADRDLLTREWSGAGRPAVPTRVPTVHGHIEAQADRTPDAVAVQYDDIRLTYAELDRRANQLAWALRDRGVGPGQVVGVALPRGPRLMVTLFAVLKSGAGYLPLEPDYPPARTEMMLTDARATTVVTDSAAVPAELLDAIARSGATPLCHRTDAADIAARPEQRPHVDVSDGDLAYVIFTSGSTGRPKGAMNEHRAVVNRLLWMHDAYGLDTGEGVLQKTPIGFDVSVWELFWPLMVGGRCVLAQPGKHRDPEYLAGLIASAGITTAHFVPSMLAAFLTASRLARVHGTLTRIVCSGEELPAALATDCARLLPGTAVHNLYGPTEAAVDVTAYSCSEGYGTRVPIGRPIDGAHIHIVDRHGGPMAIGVPGELLIGGTAVARGYWNRPGLTAERFVPDPFGKPGSRLYRTGDLAQWRPDGTLEYLGRIDNQVKLRGMRIEPGEIEQALCTHPAVDSAVVTVRTGSSGTPTLVGYVRPASGHEAPDDARLRAHVRDLLPAHMVPSAFATVPEWPLSPNGKLDRGQLPDPRPVRADAHHVAPATPVERELAGIWAQVLGVERIGATDNFFDLGGHSLLATQLIARVRARYDVELPLNRLFVAPTVRAMAEAVGSAQRRPADGPTLRRVDRSAYRVPTSSTPPLTSLTSLTES